MIQKYISHLCRTVIWLITASLAANLEQRTVQQALFSANKRRLFMRVFDRHDVFYIVYIIFRSDLWVRPRLIVLSIEQVPDFWRAVGMHGGYFI